MNIDPPENRPNPQPTPHHKRSFDDILRDLKPQLDRCPQDQIIPPLPPDQLVLTEVEEFLSKHNIKVASSTPSWIALGDEIVDRSKLREARIAVHDGFRVAFFLYKFPQRGWSTIILIPRDQIDPRPIAKGVVWGLVADVPNTICQSKVLPISEFFSACSFDLSKLVDHPVLERAKADFRRMVMEQLRIHKATISKSAKELESELALLVCKCGGLEEELLFQRNSSVTYYNRSEFWKLVAFAAVIILCPIHLFLRHLGW